MQLNEAYKILKDDYARAEYLLRLMGQNFTEESLKSKLSSIELSEIMEMYEALDEIKDMSDLLQMEAQKLQEKSNIVKELTGCFAEKKIAKALDLTVRLKYLTNLVGNIKLKIKHANHLDQ